MMQCRAGLFMGLWLCAATAAPAPAGMRWDSDGDGDLDIVTKVYTAGPGRPYARLPVLENAGGRPPRDK